MTRLAALPLLATALLLLLLASSPLIAESRAKLDGDFTIAWRQMIPAGEQVTPAMSIGATEVAIRPLPTDKPKDPPRAALFVGDALRSKTPVHPGKWYHFTLVSRGGAAQLYVNGCRDAAAPAAALAGTVETTLPDVKIANSASGERDIRQAFKAAIPKRSAIETVAHRGVNAHAPENTRISYVQAVEAGTPVVEIDTALTRDGHIILMHDKTVDRTTDGTGKVAELTLEQIRKLDAGAWKDPKYKGEPVPTIDEIDDVCRGKAAIMFDLKAEGQGKAIAEWLDKSKFPRDQVIVAPWTDEEGVAIRQYVKDVPMIRLTSKIPAEKFDDAYFQKMKQTGFSGFSVNWLNLTDAFVRAAQKNGMKVYAWTINDAPDIAGAVLLGVDGIVTDDPAPTMKQIAELVARK